MELCYAEIDSPVGPLFVAGDKAGRLVRISFLATHSSESVHGDLAARGFQLAANPAGVAAAAAQLEAYFRGELTEFSLPLQPLGTPFQLAVWRQLQAIPYGTCITYGDLADALGKPGGSRAVGMANNRNPIPIVIPCHRVIGANNRLVGFGGGAEIKYRLLQHEGYFLA